MEIAEDNRPFDKTTGIVAYMTLIGWVVALVLNNDKTGAEKRFNAFHLRQMLGLMIIGFCFWIVQIPLSFIPFIGWLFSLLVSLALFAMWIFGVVTAANGEQKEIPVVGPVIGSFLGKVFE